MKRLPIFASFILFIAMCVSATYWAMQLFKSPGRAVAAPAQVLREAINLDAAATLFGGRLASAAVASNYQLKGVIAATPFGESVAILTVDGKRSQIFSMDLEVIPGVTVKEVHEKYVLLMEGGVSKRIELPEAGPKKLQLELVDNRPPPSTTPKLTITPLENAPLMIPPRPQSGNVELGNGTQSTSSERQLIAVPSRQQVVNPEQGNGAQPMPPQRQMIIPRLH